MEVIVKKEPKVGTTELQMDGEDLRNENERRRQMRDAGVKAYAEELGKGRKPPLDARVPFSAPRPRRRRESERVPDSERMKYPPQSFPPKNTQLIRTFSSPLETMGEKRQSEKRIPSFSLLLIYACLSPAKPSAPLRTQKVTNKILARVLLPNLYSWAPI